MTERRGDICSCLRMAEATNRMLSIWLRESDYSDIHDMGIYIFNAAYCCELYLKALKMQEGSGSLFMTGHNLYNLFDALSDEYKDAVAQKYDMFIAEKGESAKVWGSSLEEALKRHSLAFM